MPELSATLSGPPAPWAAYADVLAPLPNLSPSAFAVAERVLHSVYCSERPGPWTNDVFPYQAPLMDMVQEAIRTGKRGVVYLKSAQGGGTDLAINGLLWLKAYYPGPQLFLTSKEEIAQEFGRERFESIIRDMPTLQARYMPNPHGDIQTKRFVDGKIHLSGGQSVLSLESIPYRFVGVDELDSLSENLGGKGDPLKLAEARTDSFTGSTLIIAYAHPTTRERGAARVYYQQSDQRRGFVRHGCGAEFWLQWEHVKAENPKDPEFYRYICPGCGRPVSDGERVAMVRAVEYRSTLAPAEAARRTWIGAHFSQLYYPGKTLRSIAERWVECGDDENARRVFVNKVLGEPYDPKVSEISTDTLRSLVCVKRRANDPEFYLRGQVPAGVRFLTAGQDSRTVELHYAIWGWGLRRATDGVVSLCGWLIDWGRVERAYSLSFSEAEFHVFDDLIYRRVFPAVQGDRRFHVVQAGHDIGYEPTQIPIIRYCRSWPQRAIPIKGANIEATSHTTAPYARWGSALKWKAGQEEAVEDVNSRQLLLNTFMLKTDWYGWTEPGRRIEVPDVTAEGELLGARKVARLTFPEDVADGFLRQSAAEVLGHGEKSNELIWKKTGPNHWADCNTYAYGIALNLDPFQGNQTAAEAERPKRAYVPREAERREDPALG